MKSKVVIIACRDYDDGVEEKLRRAVELLGGMESFVRKDERVLVKPNLLRGSRPERGITTHPAVFGAVLKLLRDAGCGSISYGDSPAALSEKIDRYTITGLNGEADKYGAEPGDFTTVVHASFPQGKVCREFPVCRAAEDADAIISVCKMKTHALEIITGAVKNQYGFIAGNNKAVFHAKYPTSGIFAEMLADLNLYLKPRLYVMDGIIALEGNGPGEGGDPTPMKLMLVSSDPVAMDTLFARLVYLDPKNVPTNVYGAKAGLGTMDEAEIELMTVDGTELTMDEAVKRFGNPDFNVKRTRSRFWNMRGMLGALHQERPVVDLNKCIGCGICEQACPVEGKAVHSGNGNKAKYDYKKCIRCYCCQEMCPARAITKR